MFDTRTMTLPFSWLNNALRTSFDVENTSKVCWLKGRKFKRLGTMPAPTGGQALESEILKLKEAGVDVLVNLLEPMEMRELGLEKEAAVCAAHGIEYESFPIADHGVPYSVDATELMARQILYLVNRGKNVVIHCRAGIGRASIMAACVLILSGVRANRALAMISEARGFPVPETHRQQEWVYAFQKR